MTMVKIPYPLTQCNTLGFILLFRFWTKLKGFGFKMMFTRPRMMVMLIAYAICKFAKMQNDILGARCSFGVLKCSLEAQNGHTGAQLHSDSTKCTPIVPNTPMV